MPKLKNKRGHIVHLMELNQPEVNCIFYALEAALEADDTYDVDVHDCLMEYFGGLYDEYEELDIDEEGPAQYSGYLTAVSVRDIDEQETVIDFTEALEKDKAIHGEID